MSAQEAGFRAEFLQQFGSDARKLVALAEAMPAETFDWRPTDGVSSVEEAYMHVARYNYYYQQSSFDVPVPEGVDMETIDSYQALATGTRNAAEYFGTDDFGVVAESRAADLILLDANPLVDVANLKRRAGVMVRGRWLPESEIQSRLAAVAASLRE